METILQHPQDYYVPLFGGISRPWRSSLLGNFVSYGMLTLLMTILLLALS
jgi:hypothetical protein